MAVDRPQLPSSLSVRLRQSNGLQALNGQSFQGWCNRHFLLGFRHNHNQ
jgi:type IV secretory pathway VirB10-like protein